MTQYRVYVPTLTDGRWNIRKEGCPFIPCDGREQAERWAHDLNHWSHREPGDISATLREWEERIIADLRALGHAGDAGRFIRHVEGMTHECVRRCACLNAESAIADLRGKPPPGCTYRGFVSWITEYRRPAPAPPVQLALVGVAG